MFLKFWIFKRKINSFKSVYTNFKLFIPRTYSHANNNNILYILNSNKIYI